MNSTKNKHQFVTNDLPPSPSHQSVKGRSSNILRVSATTLSNKIGKNIAATVENPSSNHYATLDAHYRRFAAPVTAFVKACFPSTQYPWAWCEDCVQELFLTLAVEGLARLGEPTLWAYVTHARRIAYRRIRRSKSVCNGGKLFREPEDISELTIGTESSQGVDNWIASHDLADQLRRFDPSVLSRKERIIWTIVKAKLPQSLSPQEILNEMSPDEAEFFAPKRRMPNPLYHTIREVGKRRSGMRKELRKFLDEDSGQ